MSNKMMLGLLVSAGLGLGAAAVSAADAKKPNGEEPEYTKKAALIVIDKDKYGNVEKFCKVPVKIRGETLQSDEPKSIKINDRKKNFVVTCKFKDVVEHPNPKKWQGVHKDGFLCKADLYDYKFKTYYSRVDVEFEHREPRNDEYAAMADYKKGKDKDKKIVVAHVVLKCLFEKKHQPKPTHPYTN